MEKKEITVCMKQPGADQLFSDPCRECGHATLVHMGVDGCPVCRLEKLYEEFRDFIRNAKSAGKDSYVLSTEGFNPVTFDPSPMADLKHAEMDISFEIAPHLAAGCAGRRVLSIENADVGNKIQDAIRYLHGFECPEDKQSELLPHVAEACFFRCKIYTHAKNGALESEKWVHGIQCPGKLRLEHAVGFFPPTKTEAGEETK